MNAYKQGNVEIITLINNKIQTFILSDVLYAPDAKNNLLSIGRLDSIGRKIEFKDNKVILKDNKNKIIVKGKLYN